MPKPKFDNYNRQTNYSPRQNRNLTTPRVHFIIPSIPSWTPLDFSSHTIQSIPPSLLKISDKILQIFNQSIYVQHPLLNKFMKYLQTPHFITKTSKLDDAKIAQGEPNLVNDPIDISSDTFFSKLYHFHQHPQSKVKHHQI